MRHIWFVLSEKSMLPPEEHSLDATADEPKATHYEWLGDKSQSPEKAIQEVQEKIVQLASKGNYTPCLGLE